MSEREREPQARQEIRKAELPTELKNILKSLSVTRSQCSLYGPDHPSTREMVQDVARVLAEFLEELGPATLVFSKDAVIVNDRYYAPTPESQNVSNRLYARATMAVTFTGPPPVGQLTEFLAFLNADPSEIREHSGPSAYLRERGVTKIAVTQAVYAGEDESQGEHDDGGVLAVPSLDRAVAGAINWLSRHDDDVDLPRVPISEILANPDMAARLIREAVSKLHASGRTEPSAELATKVIREMKDLSVDDTAGWDSAAPRIREAILKLPKHLRPGVLGFDADKESSLCASPRTTVDSAEFDARLRRLLPDSEVTGGAQCLPTIEDLESLFNAQCTGLLPNWQAELQPDRLAQASGRSYLMLMTWEGNAAEHSRIAHRLADLVRIEIEIGSLDTAVGLAGGLAAEACRVDALPGRCTNAVNALQSLGVPTLRTLLEHSIVSEDSRSHTTAAQMVECVPELALNAIEMLSGSTSALFADSLKIGVCKAEKSAAPSLRRLIESASPLAREFALDVLVESHADWAFRELQESLDQAPPELVAAALTKLRNHMSAAAVRICVRQLRHRRCDVRCAALGALGAAHDEAAFPPLVACAIRPGFLGRREREQLAAIRALGALGIPEAVVVLERVAASRSVLFPSRARRIREAALAAICDIRDKSGDAQEKAA